MNKGRSSNRGKLYKLIQTVKYLGHPLHLTAILMSQGFPNLISHPALVNILDQLGIPHQSSYLSLFFTTITVASIFATIIWEQRFTRGAEKQAIIIGFFLFITGYLSILIALAFRSPWPLFFYAFTVPTGGAFVVQTANDVIKLSEGGTKKSGYVNCLKLCLGGLLAYFGLIGPPALMATICIVGAAACLFLLMIIRSPLKLTIRKDNHAVEAMKTIIIGAIHQTSNRIKLLTNYLVSIATEDNHGIEAAKATINRAIHWVNNRIKRILKLLTTNPVSIAAVGNYVAFQALLITVPTVIKELSVTGSALLVAMIFTGFVQWGLTGLIDKKKEQWLWYVQATIRVLSLIALVALVLVFPQGEPTLIAIPFALIFILGRVTRALNDNTTHSLIIADTHEKKRTAQSAEQTIFNLSQLAGSLIIGLPLEWVFLILLLLSAISLVLTFIFKQQHRIQ